MGEPVATNKFSKASMKDFMKGISPLLAILVAFVVAGLVVFASGGDAVEAYKALASGAFGSWTGFKNTVRYTLPIIMLAFSFSICDRGGYFNIGQEGQIYFAALGMAFIPQLLPNASLGVQTVAMIIAASLCGGLISLLPALFKFLLGINEVVIAILMNYIILLLTDYLLNNGPIARANTTIPMSITLKPSMGSIVILLSVIAIILAYAFTIRYTVPGYDLRMIGYNPQFSETCGLKTIKIVLGAALLGGVFSGLTAAGEVMGVYHRVYGDFAANMGFNGMTAALIGKNSTLGIIFGSLILGALQSGAVTLSVATNVPAEIVQVVQGFVMLFATVNFMHHIIKAARKKKESR